MRLPLIIKSGWPWLLLFLLSFCVFFGRLWLNQFLDIKIREFTEMAKRMQITIKNLRFDTLPPSLHLNSIEIPVKGQTLTITRPSLELGFFPFSLHFSAQTLGGQIYAQALMQWSLPPQISRLNFRIDNFQLRNIMAFTDISPFIQTDGGDLQGCGEINIKKYANSLPDWNSASGTADFELKKATLLLKAPLLKKNEITNINGDLQLRIAGASMEIKNCHLESQPISFNARGNAKPWFSPDKARIEINTELRIPYEMIEPTLFPERTLAQIRQKSVVRTKMTGSLFAPKIYLEN